MLRHALLTGLVGLALTGVAHAGSCDGLPTTDDIKPLLAAAVAQSNGGLGFNSWATVVANDGAICAVANSGGVYTDQWLIGRLVSVQKANTANGLSLGAISGAAASKNGKFATSTANLYAGAQPGGPLFGLIASNPVNPEAAYSGKFDEQAVNPANLGTDRDPLIGRRIGGVSVLAGGLGLYDKTRGKIGGLGVAGDTACTDHAVAWRLRHSLGLDYLKTNNVSGVAAFFANDGAHPDNIIFDLKTSQPSGFGHPICLFNPPIDPGTNTLTFLDAVR